MTARSPVSLFVVVGTGRLRGNRGRLGELFVGFGRLGGNRLRLRVGLFRALASARAAAVLVRLDAGSLVGGLVVGLLAAARAAAILVRLAALMPLAVAERRDVPAVGVTTVFGVVCVLAVAFVPLSVAAPPRGGVPRAVECAGCGRRLSDRRGRRRDCGAAR